MLTIIGKTTAISHFLFINNLKTKVKKHIIIFMKTIDIHIHGGFGINFDKADSNAIRDFAKQAFEKGIAAFCPTLTGECPEKMQEKLEAIKEAKASQKKGEALIIGANLEGTFLSREKPGVQNPDVFLEPDIENFKKITGKFEDIVKIVVMAPENKSCDEFIKYLKSKDIKVHFGHTAARSLEGADCINHLFNAMEPMTHKHETLAIKALLDKEIYTELIADTIHVTEDVLKLTFKTRPLNKIILISDALPIASSNSDEIEFCGKKILKNGFDEKGTLGGSVMLLPEIVRQLDKKGILPLESGIKAAFDNPRDYLKLMV